MVHTRSGAGTEPLTLPDQLNVVASRGIQCPVCYERRSLCCMALARCGHGICIACAPDFFYHNFKANQAPSCPECRAEAAGDSGASLYTYLYEPGFREAAVLMLRRLSDQ